ncbi:hypothetical protein F4811DRAFT_194665 [Daldinia bambusicola]|nr:hypothetical protein F4811DRAFT_194665 [Daldinia bambusicola]
MKSDLECFNSCHNTIIFDLVGVPADLVFARFAWLIYESKSPTFFRAGWEYYVRAWVKNVKGEWERKDQMLRGSEIRNRFRKRNRTSEEDNGLPLSRDATEDQYLSPTNSPASGSSTLDSEYENPAEEPESDALHDSRPPKRWRS